MFNVEALPISVVKLSWVCHAASEQRSLPPKYKENWVSNNNPVSLSLSVCGCFQIAKNHGLQLFELILGDDLAQITLISVY